MALPVENECISCGEVENDPDLNERCPESKHPGGCGHHCNHSWSHDTCCWCGCSWGEAGAFTPGPSHG